MRTFPFTLITLPLIKFNYSGDSHIVWLFATVIATCRDEVSQPQPITYTRPGH